MRIILLSIFVLFSTQLFAEPALVFRADNVCTAPVPNPDTANGLPVLGEWVGNVHIVGRDAGGDVFPGSGKLTCTGNHEVDLAKAGVAKGLTCFIVSMDQTLVYITDDTVAVATPGGKAMFYCNFSKDATIVIPNEP